MPLTPSQIKLLHVAKSKTRMADENYRALLSRFGTKARPCSSSKDPRLQPANYDEMMRVFASLGFRPKAKNPGSRLTGTPAQRALIGRLCREHGVDEKRRAGIVKHVTGKDAEKWCGTKDLSKVIQALKRWRWEKAS